MVRFSGGLGAIDFISKTPTYRNRAAGRIMLPAPCQLCQLLPREKVEGSSCPASKPFYYVWLKDSNALEGVSERKVNH